jgi:hypothetical protein
MSLCVAVGGTTLTAYGRNWVSKAWLLASRPRVTRSPPNGKVSAEVPQLSVECNYDFSLQRK